MPRFQFINGTLISNLINNGDNKNNDNVTIKLIENAKIIKLFVIIFLVTYFKQNSKTKHLLKIKPSKCSLTA